MRHVRSILYAVVLAAAVWVLCGAGLGYGHSGTGTDVRNYPDLLLLLVAGVAYAILIFAPISPAGPLAGGVVFLAASVWALASPSSYADLWPAGVSWADLSLPGHGISAILAVPMIGTALIARRWETYEPPELPVFGRLGRTPGVARPPGPPVAELDTAVVRLSDPDNTVMVIDMDQTQVVRAPEPPAPDLATLVPQLVSEHVVEAAESTTVLSKRTPGSPSDSQHPAGSPRRPTDSRQLGDSQRPADETMVIPPWPADETMAIPSPEVVAAADATQVIPRDLGGDRQVIKPPVSAPEPAEIEQTQIVKAPDLAGADQTQVIRFPAPVDAGAEPTRASAASQERPADEVADDTRPLRLRPVRGPRRREEDDGAG